MEIDGQKQQVAVGTQLNTERYFDLIDPLNPPPPPLPRDTLYYASVAPVFKNWQVCLSRFMIDESCQKANPIIGFAISYADTWYTFIYSTLKSYDAIQNKH